MAGSIYPLIKGYLSGAECVSMHKKRNDGKCSYNG